MLNSRSNYFLIFASLMITLQTVSVLGATRVDAAMQSLIFPVLGSSSYSNDFYAPRSNGMHRGTDIIANKHQLVVSASQGVIQYVTWWEGAGYSVRIRGADGYTYNYYHLNNDNPRTDDGKGYEMKAFAPDIQPGNPIAKGQLLGYVGDSGNAEPTVPHLHFEIYNGTTAINPYYPLNRAVRIAQPRLYPALANETLPYGNGSFRGGARIASGDVDGDGIDEIVAAAGPGGSSVRIFETNGTQVRMFTPYPNDFRGGADVAAGDIDADGVDEIIVAAGPGGTSVRIFKMDGTQVGMFTPYPNGFTGGADVAAGDIDADGVDEIIVAAGPGGSSVRIFEPNGTQVGMFNPYGGFKGGTSVAVGDVTGTVEPEIVVAARKTGGPHVITFSASGVPLTSFMAYASTVTNGVRVEVGDVFNEGGLKEEILAIPETNGTPKVKVLNASGQHLRDSTNVAEWWWKGYHDVAVVEGDMLVSLNINRRTSLRYAQ